MTFGLGVGKKTGSLRGRLFYSAGYGREAFTMLDSVKLWRH